jgi:periplasmic protein TonB
MAMLSRIPAARAKWGRLSRLTDTQPISDWFWRAALSALCVVALGALLRVAASAQQNPEPQPEAVQPVVTGPSPHAPVSSAVASWQQSMVARLARLHYPPQARGVQGVVSLAFSVDRHGNLVSSRIVKSSGSALLDAAALDLIKRAAPLPPPPAEIADSELSFVVPIRFAAR